MTDTSGVILAGLYRWTNSGLDGLLPRPLMPIAHTPLICHVLSWLRRADVVGIGICANSSSRQVRRILDDGAKLGLDLEYYEDWSPRGPAGCVRDVAERLTGRRLVVVEGTIIPDCDLRNILETHDASGAALTVVAAPEHHDQEDQPDRLVPTGIYIVEANALGRVPEAGYQDLKEGLIPRLYEQEVPVITYSLAQPCRRVTDEASYLALNAWILERLTDSGETLTGYRRVDFGYVHQSARLSSPECCIGPLLIGPNTIQGDGATLIGPAIIGAHCVVEAGAVVSRSVLWDRCHIGRGASVDRSILGDYVRVEPDTHLYATTCSTVPRH